MTNVTDDLRAIIVACHLHICCINREYKIFTWGPIYQISYDLSYSYLNFIVGSTYDSDLQCAKIYSRNTHTRLTPLFRDYLGEPVPER